VPRVLVITPNFEDYLTDAVLHGLRTLLGDDVVDFPKAEALYMSDAERSERVRGGGFTLYGTLEDIPIDRHRVLWRAAQEREFDLVVFGDIWRTFGLWTELAPQLKGVPVAVLDGADRVEPFPYGGLWWRVSSWWTLPRVQRRGVYFKREITKWTYWFRSYLLLPPRFARAIGLLREMRPIAFAIPEEKIVAAPPPKEKDLPEHVVDEEVAAAMGGQTSYAFADEDAYYDDLRRSRFGITVKRAGWDALRHYEIAANGAVPCFRDLDRKPASCAPHGLIDGVNCIVYHSADELRGRIAALDEAGYARLQAGALEWVRANTTVVRAREVLGVFGLAA
jgi:hypothetical protein